MCVCVCVPCHTSHCPLRPLSCSLDQMLCILPACSGWLLLSPHVHWCFSIWESYTRPAHTHTHKRNWIWSQKFAHTIFSVNSTLWPLTILHNSSCIRSLLSFHIYLYLTYLWHSKLYFLRLCHHFYFLWNFSFFKKQNIKKHLVYKFFFFHFSRWEAQVRR